MATYFDRDLGERIDADEGLPVSMISCPSCGRTYKQQKHVCTECEECKKCCTCEKPNIVTAAEMIERVHKNG